MRIQRDVISNNLIYAYYTHSEISEFMKSDMLKKLGLYPKNREIMLKALISQGISLPGFHPYYLFWHYCEQSDIEFLRDKVTNDIFEEILRFNRHLSIGFIEKMELSTIYIRHGCIKKRTYGDLFRIISKYPTPILNLANTKPKNSKEKYYKKMLCEKMNTYYYKPYDYQLSNYIETILVYNHLRKN